MPTNHTQITEPTGPSLTVWLQPSFHTVAASISCGCSLPRLWLQPLLFYIRLQAKSGKAVTSGRAPATRSPTPSAAAAAAEAAADAAVAEPVGLDAEGVASLLPTVRELRLLRAAASCIALGLTHPK